jgi:hypothetical protein
MVLSVMSLVGSAHAARHLQWSLTSSSDGAASGVTAGASSTTIVPMRKDFESVDKQGGSPFLGFSAVSVGERGNKPCSVSFGVSALDESYKSAGTASKVPCDKGDPSDTNTAKLPDDAFVRGVQVCTNGDEKSPQVKGLKLFGVRFDDKGKPSNLSEPASFEESKCKKWHETRTCRAAGEIVSQLKIYKNNDIVTAIGIECRPVYGEETSPKDVTLTVESLSFEPQGTSTTLFKHAARLRLKNNTSQALVYGSVGLRPNPSKYPSFTCGVTQDNHAALPANGTRDHDLTTVCNWGDLLATIPGCNPGDKCLVDFSWSASFSVEPYGNFARPVAGQLGVSMRRPARTVAPVKAVGAVPPSAR